MLRSLSALWTSYKNDLFRRRGILLPAHPYLQENIRQMRQEGPIHTQAVRSFGNYAEIPLEMVFSEMDTAIQRLRVGKESPSLVFKKSRVERKSDSEEIYESVKDCHYNLGQYLVTLEIIGMSSENAIEVTVTGPSDQVVGELCKELLATARPPIPHFGRSQSVYTLTNAEGGGLDLLRLGSIKIPLERANYTPEVLQQYDHINACLSSPTPCGRLNILSGPPGTGKSFIIRGLIQQAEAVSIFIPPHMLSALTTPSLVAVIAKARRTAPELPIIFIVEDADHALVKRSSGDLSALSTLLNFGDGLMGELLDVRAIATTNARTDQMDDAITRPGRLCRHVELGELEPDLANEVFSRLAGQELETREKLSLAEVYRIARQTREGDKQETFRPKARAGKALAGYA